MVYIFKLLLKLIFSKILRDCCFQLFCAKLETVDDVSSLLNDVFLEITGKELRDE